jgi:hypothetical protein
MARYKTKVSKDGTQEIVAFTPEEEAQKDAEEKKWNDVEPIRAATIKIQELEGQITNRRLRDALASDEGKKWVADQEALIATERAKL